MMEQHKGYWNSGSAIPGPPNTSYWEALGIVLKSGVGSSLVEVVRLQDNDINFDMEELAESYGMELCRIAVDERLAEG